VPALATAAPAARLAAQAPAKPASVPVSATASATGKFMVNVGLFADPNNARNAYTKLQEGGLPALSQAWKSAKGLRTRVRAGPFESQAEADRAAEKIRALRLDAAVVKP
jgi:cell division septation protein DedD